MSQFLIGLILALFSSFFIGISFVVKKKGLLKVEQNSTFRASAGGHGYLMEWLWWAGLFTMGIGEAANFAAYAFAPAILVTPLGALSVIFSAILASYFLKEGLNSIAKAGCLLCIFGSIIIVIHAPNETVVFNLSAIQHLLFQPLIVSYFFFSILITIILILYVVPKYGQSNIFVYLLICSLIGSLTVIMTKGLSLALRLTIQESNQFLNPITWVFLIGLILFILLQMNYLNRALDTFSISLVTPVYYVMFTTLTIIASAILFKDWERLSTIDNLTISCGFFTIVIGIFLLNTYKDIDLKNVVTNNCL